MKIDFEQTLSSFEVKDLIVTLDLLVLYYVSNDKILESSPESRERIVLITNLIRSDFNAHLIKKRKKKKPSTLSNEQI